jgi:tetratricopeptide (TPR) repeat protein
LDQAAIEYEQALSSKRDYAEAHSNLGDVLRAQGKFEEATDQYRRALALMPNATTHFYLGKTLRDLGNLDEALAQYRLALALAPNLAEAHKQSC